MVQPNYPIPPARTGSIARGTVLNCARYCVNYEKGYFEFSIRYNQKRIVVPLPETLQEQYIHNMQHSPREENMQDFIKREIKSSNQMMPHLKLICNLDYDIYMQLLTEARTDEDIKILQLYLPDNYQQLNKSKFNSFNDCFVWFVLKCADCPELTNFINTINLDLDRRVWIGGKMQYPYDVATGRAKEIFTRFGARPRGFKHFINTLNIFKNIEEDMPIKAAKTTTLSDAILLPVLPIDCKNQIDKINNLSKDILSHSAEQTAQIKDNELVISTITTLYQKVSTERKPEAEKMLKTALDSIEADLIEIQTTIDGSLLKDLGTSVKYLKTKRI